MIRTCHPFRTAPALASVLLLAACCTARAADEGEAPPPLKFHAAPQGMLTHWLVAPPADGPVAKLDTPPAEARLGDPAPGGEWTLLVSRSGEINLKPLLRIASKGHVWCTLRVNSLTGGRRRLTVAGFSGIRAFLGGAKVIDKPAPEVPRADQAGARIELPKGESLLQVAVDIRWGHCRFVVQLAEEDGKMGAAGDDLLLRVAPGAKDVPDTGELLARSVSFLPQKYFIEAGQPVKFGIGLESAWPLGVGRIKPVVRGPDGQAYALGRNLVPKAPDELNAAPWIFELPAPAPVPARLDLACDLVEAEGEKVLGSATLRLFSLAGIATEHAACEALLQKTAAEAKQPLSAFPNTALALEKLANWLRDLVPPAGDVPAALPPHMDSATGATLLGLLDEAARCLPLEKDGRDPFEGRTGYFERAYWSDIEEASQPYFMLAPSAWKKSQEAKDGEATKRFPLVIFLHGYVPDYHKHRWWTEMPAFNALFEKNDCFLAIPFGRSNADFLGAGEVDVLDAVAEMQRIYPIDPDRVYLYGYSMGGMAVYTLGGHYPGRFAAGVVLAGRADSPLLMGTGGLATLHPFKQFLVRTDTPIELCENFVNTPLRIYHGADDTVVKPSEAERMAARLKEIGCDVQLNLPPGDHWSLFDVMQDEEPLAWLLKQKRDPNPKTGWLRNFSLTFGRYGDVGGLAVYHATGALHPFEMSWTNGEKLVIEKVDPSVTNVSLGVRLAGSVEVKDNAAELKLFSAIEGKKSAYYLSSVAGPQNEKPPIEHLDWKSHINCGPIKEATYRGFLVVYGTTGGAEVTARLKAQAQKFADEWYAFAKSRPPLKADTEVTDDEKKARNLFLFGEEQENALHAACAATKKLPIVVKDGKVTIGEQTVPLKDRGMMYIFPNPLGTNPISNSVVICAGLSYGEHLPGNHKLDLLPDFLLYTAEPDLDGTRTNRPVCAGFFDGKWRMSKETTWWFGPAAGPVKESSPVPPPKEKEKEPAPEPEAKTEIQGQGGEAKTAPRKTGPKVAPSQP